MAEYKILKGGFHEKFHDCRSKIQIIGGGFANGKTSAVCLKAINLARDYPGSNGLVGRATYPKLNDTIKKEFFKWLPKNWIKRYSEKDNTVILVNGSTINFRYVQQQKREKSPSSTSNLLSATYDWMMIDQMDDPEFDYKDFIDLIGRLRGTTPYKGTDPTMPDTGPRWFCITLNPTRNWIYRKLIQHVLTYQTTGKIASDLQSMLDGYQTTIVSDLITVHTASTYENSHNLTSDYIHSMEAVYFGAMKDRFLLGGWEAFQGLIYPMFDQYLHMIPEDQVVDWIERIKPDRILEMYDHGLTSTSCYMVALGDLQGNYIVVDGFHNKNQSIETSISKIKSIRKEWRIPPDLPHPIYADPAVFRKTSGEFKTVGKSIVDIFRANGQGINMTRGNNDISGGIAKISSYLTSYPDHENPITLEKNAPFLYFNEDRLQFVLDEITDYFYIDSDDPDAETDKPMGGKDHAMDALKYGLTSTPSVIELLPVRNGISLSIQSGKEHLMAGKLLDIPGQAVDTAAVATDKQLPPDNSAKAYQLNPSTKVRISKAFGKIWKSRKDQAQKRRENLKLDAAWEQCVKYYQNDQIKHRSKGATGETMGNGLADRIQLEFSETENVVFSNVASAIPVLYAKNPTVEISSYNPELEDRLKADETLINVLFEKKDSPGINLKLKAKRAVLTAFLTNIGWLEVGWIYKEQVMGDAINDYSEVQNAFETEKNQEEIKELEGRLAALEEKVSFREEPGPFVKFRRPIDMLVDPDAVEEDGSDANWIMVRDYERTSKLKAMYFDKNGEKSLYEPSYVVPSEGSATDINEIINNFHIFAHDDPDRAGYDDDDTYNAAQITETWTVWDKVSRRIYKYNAKNWSWPLWVWDDPYQLTTFYPFARLQFHQSPNGGEMKGEVSYYLDQQDAINLWNSIRHQVTSWAVGKIAYNKSKVTRSDAEKMLTSGKMEVVGVDVPDGTTLEEMMPKGMEHPGAKVLSMYTKEDIYRAIDKISSVSDILRGGEFKTNTTNDAVNTYQSVQQTRFDALVDGIEDFIGHVGYLLAQLCWKNMEPQLVISLIGSELGSKWSTLDNDTIKAMTLNVEGGSTLKPTSDNKKKEAIELTQILGQFASSNPLAGPIALKVLSRAFESVVITDKEWEMMYMPLLQAMMPQPEPQIPGQEGEVPVDGRASNGMDASAPPSDVALQ